MKSTIDRQAFLDAWGDVAPAIPTNSPMVCIQSALLSASEDGTELVGTNLELGVSRRVTGVTVQEPGKVLLSPRFHQVLTSSSDQTLDLETVDSRLVVKGKSSTHRMPLEDVTKYPAPGNFNADSYWIVAAADLRRAIRKTVFATTEQTTNYALGGVQFEFGAERLYFAAFDQNRMAMYDCPATTEGNVPQGFKPPSIPAKALKLVERMLADDSPSVDIAITGKSSVAFRCDGAVVWTRTLEGEFPGHIAKARQLKPTDKALVGVGDLSAAVASAAVMTTDESRAVHFEFEGGTLILRAESPDVGDCEVNVPIQWEGGGARGVSVQGRFPIALLKVCDPEAQVSVGLFDDGRALIFDCGGYRHFVSTLTLRNPESK